MKSIRSELLLTADDDPSAPRGRRVARLWIVERAGLLGESFIPDDKDAPTLAGIGGTGGTLSLAAGLGVLA